MNIQREKIGFSTVTNDRFNKKQLIEAVVIVLTNIASDKFYKATLNINAFLIPLRCFLLYKIIDVIISIKRNNLKYLPSDILLIIVLLMGILFCHFMQGEFLV